MITTPTLSHQYPHLFQQTTWPGPTQVQFQCLDEIPPLNLISNVNLVPRTDEGWVIIQLADGSWEIPGGTLEPNETYQEALARELMEEAGARLQSFHLLGAWHCRSFAPKPYRPHLPYPESYRIVGLGEVVLVQAPENPSDGEQVRLVESVSLETAMARFQAIERWDLAELYALASV